MITTLFNLFCPYTSVYIGLELSVFLLVVTTFLILSFTVGSGLKIITVNFKGKLRTLFPQVSQEVLMFIRAFLILAIFNLISLVTYSYPTTTTLRFNLGLAFRL